MCVEICIQANISRICGLTKGKQGYNQLPSHPHIVQTEATIWPKRKYSRSLEENKHCELTLEECVTLSSAKISLLKTFPSTTKENWATFQPWIDFVLFGPGQYSDCVLHITLIGVSIGDQVDLC